MTKTHNKIIKTYKIKKYKNVILSTYAICISCISFSM